MKTIGNTQLRKYHDSNINIDYKYNKDGIRTSKMVNNVEIKYYLEGMKIIFEQIDDTVLYYMYSKVGELIGFKYNDTSYYYIKNNQNDTIGIIQFVKEERKLYWNMKNKYKIFIIGSYFLLTFILALSSNFQYFFFYVLFYASVLLPIFFPIFLITCGIFEKNKKWVT